MKFARLTLAAALGVIALMIPGRLRADLVTNGNFGTGDFSGWTQGGNFEDTEVVGGAFYVYTGAEGASSYYAVLGPVESDGTLSQSFTTDPGASYTFTFWLASAGDDPSDFSAYWDGTSVLALADPSSGAAWTQYTYTETGSGSDSITFNFRDDPAYIALDNVSVTPAVASALEPGTLSMMYAGLLGLCLLAGWKRYRAHRLATTE